MVVYEKEFTNFVHCRRKAGHLSSDLQRVCGVLSFMGVYSSAARVNAMSRAVQFSILSRDLEEVVDVEPGAPSGVFDVFVRAGAKQIVGERA